MRKPNYYGETEISSEDADSKSQMSGATSAEKTMNANNAIPTESAVSSI